MQPDPSTYDKMVGTISSSTEGLKLFGLLYLVSLAAGYVMFIKGGKISVMPWDIYMIRGGRRIYIPVGTALILTIILSLAAYWLKNKLG